MAVPKPYQKQLLQPRFLRKVSWVVGKSFLGVSTFGWKELVHWLAERFQTYRVSNLQWLLAWKCWRSSEVRVREKLQPSAWLPAQRKGFKQNALLSMPRVIAMIVAWFAAAGVMSLQARNQLRFSYQLQ